MRPKASVGNLLLRRVSRSFWWALANASELKSGSRALTIADTALLVATAVAEAADAATELELLESEPESLATGTNGFGWSTGQTVPGAGRVPLAKNARVARIVQVDLTRNEVWPGPS